IAYPLDLDRINLASLGADDFLAKHAEIVGFDFVAIDDLITHALLACSDRMLQGDLIGGFVQQTAIQRQADRIAAVLADDLLGLPVEGVFNAFALAQTATLEAVGLW